MTDDRYGADVLAGFRLQRGPADIPKAPIEIGLVVEDAASGFVGAVVRYTSGLAEYFEVIEAQQQLFPAENAFPSFNHSSFIFTAPIRDPATNISPPGDWAAAM